MASQTAYSHVPLLEHGIQFFAVAETEIKADGTALVPARCTNTGPEGNVEAGTVTTITNPGAIAGITGVTNAAAFTASERLTTSSATATMLPWTSPAA